MRSAVVAGSCMGVAAAHALVQGLPCHGAALRQRCADDTRNGAHSSPGNNKAPSSGAGYVPARMWCCRFCVNGFEPKEARRVRKSNRFWYRPCVHVVLQVLRRLLQAQGRAPGQEQ